MTGFWRNWLMVWAASVAVFGIALMGTAFPATEGPFRTLLAWIAGQDGMAMAQSERFAWALCGAVTTGWAGTLVAALRGAWTLGDAGRPVWRLLTLSVVGWFVIDSSLSAATGFERNALSNFVLLAAYLLPVWRSGVLRGGTPDAQPALR
ncbi:hypothetical protein [Glacieibacterium frigidum]|uniref:Uncharacterized protein n=1 Tax=Glacieibacterium frigidum TaxID=2593303 RepID=A0A552U9E6_9SPHN|nr:hypothetical protein [Glacieibacterium frigidum]TRW14842.1 hypothetical protein FMM06_14300 [Glacieibacterium frigidum]